MPTILRVNLNGPPPVSPHQHATGLHAIVLKWIGIAEPELAKSIHDSNQRKPVCISPLRASDEGLSFEVTVLSDHVLQPLMAGVSGASSNLRLGYQQYQVLGLDQIAHESYHDLLSVPIRTHFEREMKSPTAHHISGAIRKPVVLPSPELYFGSWLGAWNVCNEEKIDNALLEIVASNVAVTKCKGETHEVQIDGKRKFIGFVGNVQFTVLKSGQVPPERLKELSVLADFSKFCGTGVDTMRGMGVTRPLI